MRFGKLMLGAMASAMLVACSGEEAEEEGTPVEDAAKEASVDYSCDCGETQTVLATAPAPSCCEKEMTKQ